MFAYKSIDANISIYIKSKEQKIDILRKYIQNHPNLGLLISSNKEKHLLEISKLW